MYPVYSVGYAFASELVVIVELRNEAALKRSNEPVAWLLRSPINISPTPVAERGDNLNQLRGGSPCTMVRNFSSVPARRCSLSA